MVLDFWFCSPALWIQHLIGILVVTVIGPQMDATYRADIASFRKIVALNLEESRPDRAGITLFIQERIDRCAIRRSEVTI
ncbi:hypothetical protein AURDEDRAFT_171534 [Auricularia subglabra TFB-10046 SS5]|nr:hypothetical protein AURDEDRAFT_171534 [Auricularia subglabra TFB-10046 SS5]